MVVVHARPVEASLHLLDGLVLAEMTARRRVVALLQDARLQREVVRDVQRGRAVVEDIRLAPAAGRTRVRRLLSAAR